MDYRKDWAWTIVPLSFIDNALLRKLKVYIITYPMYKNEDILDNW